MTEFEKLFERVELSILVYQNKRKEIIPTNPSIINMQHKMWQRRGATTTLAAALYGWRAA